MMLRCDRGEGARPTLTIDEKVLCAVKVRGARTRPGDGEVIEEALAVKLGFDLLDQLWTSWEGYGRGRERYRTLAVEAQHKTRRVRR